MKRIQAIASALLLCATIAMISCNEPLQIGTELLDNGEFQFTTTDTVSIEALTIQKDSIFAYEPQNFILSSHRLGWVSDPIFGEHSSEVIFQIIPETNQRPEGTLDSIVLSLELDTFPIYGDDMASFNIRASRSMTEISGVGTYYTDSEFEKGSAVGATLNYTPRTDSMTIVEIDRLGELDTLQVAAQLRFRLSSVFGSFLMGLDTVNYTIADSFFSSMSGLILEQDGMNNAMLPIRLRGALSQGVPTTITNNKVSLYFKDENDLPAQFDYRVIGSTLSVHDHDYSTGTIQGSIGNPTASESLLYMQGAGGPVISAKLPYIQSLGDITVNEAKLTVTTELLPQDDRNLYPLPDQIYLSYRRDTLDILIPDVVAAVESFRDASLFGGQPVNVNSEVVYTFNLSEHIQSMIAGDVPNEIFIQHAQNSNRVERVVFKGINDPDHPIKLEITYTE